MIKADIVRKLVEGLSSEHQQFKDKEALYIADALIESFKDVILRDGRLEIRDFGVFQVKERKERIGRNPKNKKPYPIPSHRVVTFKPGKELRSVSAPKSSGDSDDSSDVD